MSLFGPSKAERDLAAAQERLASLAVANAHAERKLAELEKQRGHEVHLTCPHGSNHLLSVRLRRESDEDVLRDWIRRYEAKVTEADAMRDAACEERDRYRAEAHRLKGEGVEALQKEVASLRQQLGRVDPALIQTVRRACESQGVETHMGMPDQWLRSAFENVRRKCRDDAEQFKEKAVLYDQLQGALRKLFAIDQLLEDYAG